MRNTNLVLGIVKIVEKPKQYISKNQKEHVEFRAQFPHLSNNIIVKITCWGKLGETIMNHYRTDDYVIIQGFVNLNYSSETSLRKQIINIKASKIHFLC